MDLGLKGKAALVGGSSKGIGRAIAMSLAREGCNVSVCARDNAAPKSRHAENDRPGVENDAGHKFQRHRHADHGNAAELQAGNNLPGEAILLPGTQKEALEDCQRK